MTGRIITAAAAIMFCVFGSFIINDPLHILKVFGLGLAVAVAVDVTLVRMVLVPSLMELWVRPTGGCPAGSIIRCRASGSRWPPSRSKPAPPGPMLGGHEC